MGWQYQEYYVGDVLSAADTTAIASLGAEDWELVGVAGGAMWFKKPSQPNATFDVTQTVTAIGTTETAIVPAGNAGVVNGVDIVLSGQAPARSVTTIQLVSADYATVFWSCVIDLNAANQAAVIPFQPLIQALMLYGLDLAPGLTLQTVAATAAPTWTLSATVNVSYAAAAAGGA
jgi:hypothetical protein